MGYLAEMDGDRETADYYYDKAEEADQSSMKVAYATRKDVEGMKLSAVAGDSDDAVNKATEEQAAVLSCRGRPGGPAIPQQSAGHGAGDSAQAAAGESNSRATGDSETNCCSRCPTTSSRARQHNRPRPQHSRRAMIRGRQS